MKHRVPAGTRLAAVQAALVLLREARTVLLHAEIPNAHAAAHRAIKSAEGAERNARRFVGWTPRNGQGHIMRAGGEW